MLSLYTVKCDKLRLLEGIQETGCLEQVKHIEIEFSS